MPEPKMLSLSEYEKIAMKIISNYRKICGRIAITDELIGRMIRFMAKADWKYDPSFGMKAYDYRQMKAIYAIREYIKDFKKRKYNVNEYVRPEQSDVTFLQLFQQQYSRTDDYDEEKSKKIKFLRRNASLSKEENLVVDSYLEGLSISQMAESLGMNYDRCRNLFDASIRKMRRISK